MKISTKEFTLVTDTRNCVHEIRPNLKQMTGKAHTIGAIADDHAVHTQTLARFFDPKARGDVRIFDELLETHIALSKRSRTPHFRARQAWKNRKDHIEWVLNIRHTAGKERELTVELTIPHPIFPGSMGSGWECELR